jgi:hypothetical protein
MGKAVGAPQVRLQGFAALQHCLGCLKANYVEPFKFSSFGGRSAISII